MVPSMFVCPAMSCLSRGRHARCGGLTKLCKIWGSSNVGRRSSQNKRVAQVLGNMSALCFAPNSVSHLEPCGWKLSFAKRSNTIVAGSAILTTDAALNIDLATTTSTAGTSASFIIIFIFTMHESDTASITIAPS